MKKILKELFRFGGNLSKRATIILTVIGAFVLIGIWHLLTVNGYVPRGIFPTPISVFLGFNELWYEHNLLSEACFSISLNLFGYFFGILFAIPLGFLIGIYALPRAMFKKYTDGMGYIPPPSLTGLFGVAFGYGFEMKGIFLAFTIFISLLPAVIQKIVDLQNPKNDKDFVYLQTIKTLGANSFRKLTKVYIPYVMGRVWDDICQLTKISWTYIVIVELLNRQGGLGGLLHIVKRQGQIGLYFGILVTIIIIGMTQDGILREFGKLLFPYKYKKVSIIKQFCWFIKKMLIKLYHICFETKNKYDLEEEKMKKIEQVSVDTNTIILIPTQKNSETNEFDEDGKSTLDINNGIFTPIKERYSSLFKK